MSESFETSKDVSWLKDLYFSDPDKCVTLSKGDILLKEGTYNDKLFLILDGSVKGYLQDENGENFEVFESRRNMFLGVYSFFSPEHITYLTIIANDTTRLAFVDQDIKVKSEDVFAAHFLPVIVHELYLRQMLTQKLTQQRQAALRKLFENEKMATLGQLAAGLAHELNNSVGVLKRNTEWLIQSLSNYLKDKKLNTIFEQSLNEGLAFDTKTIREKRKDLEKKYDLTPKLAKQLAKTSLTPEQISRLLKNDPRILDAVNLVTEAGFVLHDMRIAADHSTHVVQSVRDLGSNNKENDQRTSVYLTITQSLALLKNSLQGVHIEINKEAEGMVMASPGDLVQIWLNLIKNACESMGSANTIDPMLVIDIASSEGYVSVSVRDNGPGIDLEVQPKIFEPNFTTKVKGLSFGLGLGLSIVKKIVMSYKGRISVSSQPGETQFRIDLPIVKDRMNTMK